MDVKYIYVIINSALNMKSKLVTYQVLCVLRIVLTLIPQSGYIHPDEHFQGPEIVYGILLLFEQSYVLFS